MHFGVVFAINGVGVTPPDEEVWVPIVIGTDLSALQKRSPYRKLEWRKRVGEWCDLDWFNFDNQVLTSLATRAPGRLRWTEIYTDAICQSVVFRQRHGVGQEIVATFLVNLN